jgi:hypothetical protein
MRRIPPAWLAGITGILMALTGHAGAAAESPAPEWQELEIITQAGQRHAFQVEIADTDAERRRGLMFRERLGERQGMLFLYPTQREVGIWMRNTLLPLDVLFIDGGGRIVRIAHDAVPYSEATIRSGRPVGAVLEINAGTAHALGIREGDVVHFAPGWPVAGAR